MHGSLAIHASLLYGFLLVLARVAGIFLFIPLPGLKTGPDVAKITLALALTLALCSRWPVINDTPMSMMRLAGWVLAEAGIGLAIGLAVAFIIEGLLVAAQAISTQAGFSYASTIDPNTEADSTVLVIIAQLTAGLLFFAMGMHRQLLSILGRSLETHPPGSAIFARANVEGLLMLGSVVFTTGVRLVLPLMTLLFLIDLSIGLLGRINAQLQMIALAFPAKMLTAMAALSLLLFLAPKLYQQSANASFGALGKLLGF
jgi:flagellar biosynthetic protein FliR